MSAARTYKQPHIPFITLAPRLYSPMSRLKPFQSMMETPSAGTMLHEHATANDIPAIDLSAQFFDCFKDVILVVSCIALGIIALHWILFFAFICLHWRQEVNRRSTNEGQAGE